MAKKERKLVANNKKAYHDFFIEETYEAGIVLTGIGAAMTVDMQLIPNSGDGIVNSIARRCGRELGFTKNIFDCGCVAVSLLVGAFFGDPLLGIGNTTSKQVADRKCNLVHVFGDRCLVVQDGGIAGVLRRAAEDQRWKHHEEQQRDRKDGEQRKEDLLPMLGCRDCNAGSRAVGSAADLNGFIQTGLPVFIYAHSSTKTTDMISCPVTG